MLKVDIIAVGTRPPPWVSEGIEDYRSRMKRECQFTVREIRTADRKKPQSIDVYRDEESRGLLGAVARDAKVIAMDARGKIWSTEQLAEKISSWSQSTNHFQFLVGGPDGLAESCIDQADETWSLSKLTFPHFLVRVLLAEQVYRALSINGNHPYHR